MTLRLNGSNSGFTEVKAPATAGSNTITLPTSNGSANQYLKNGSTAGTLEFANGGKLLQVVSVLDGDHATTTAIIPLDDTKPQNTEGAEFLTAAITPTSSTSKLWINVTVNLAANPADTVAMALFQDSGADALAATLGYMPTNNGSQVMTLNHYMTAGTTSATTFKLRAGNTNAGTIAMNGGTTSRYFGGTASSGITIMEIAA